MAIHQRHKEITLLLILRLLLSISTLGFWKISFGDHIPCRIHGDSRNKMKHARRAEISEGDHSFVRRLVISVNRVH